MYIEQDTLYLELLQLHSPPNSNIYSLCKSCEIKVVIEISVSFFPGAGVSIVQGRALDYIQEGATLGLDVCVLSVQKRVTHFILYDQEVVKNQTKIFNIFASQNEVYTIY